MIGVALKYVDECCIGWIFYNEDTGQSATKGAIDGVVIYVQNWKRVLGDALKITMLAILLTFGILALILFLMFAFLDFYALGLHLVFAIFVIATTLKKALIDSWVMIKMLSGYMEVAPQTELTFDIYTKLSGISPAFKEMCAQAGDEIGRTANTGTGEVSGPVGAAGGVRQLAFFCGECGSRNDHGTKFCGDCGTAI